MQLETLQQEVQQLSVAQVRPKRRQYQHHFCSCYAVAVYTCRAPPPPLLAVKINFWVVRWTTARVAV